MGSNPPMRKFEHEVKERDIIMAILNQCPFITVSANVEGDVPYTVPVCFGSDCDDEEIRIYVHTAREGRKADMWFKEPEVFVVGAYLYNNMNPERYYRGFFHDYRSIMAKGRIKRIPRNVKGNGHGIAVQAMLRNYDRGPTHFDVPHYTWMDVYCIHCKWEDVSCKAEGPMDQMKYVRFPEKDEPVISDPLEYTWFFCRKFFQNPPVGRMPAPLEAAPVIAEPTAIDVKDIIVETSWDDKCEHGHVDCDAYPLLLQEDGTLYRRYDMVFYNQPTTFRTDAIKHLEDDIKNELGRERWEADLEKVFAGYGSMQIMLGVYDAERREKCLGCVENIAVTVKDKSTGAPILRYEVKAALANKPAMQIAKIVKDGDKYLFVPEEKAYDKWMMPDLFAEYGLKNWRE